MLCPASPPAGSPEYSGISGYSLYISPGGKEGRESGGLGEGAPNPPSFLQGRLTALPLLTKSSSRQPVPPSSELPAALLWPQTLTRRDSAWLCRQRLEPTARTPEMPNSEPPGASSTGPSSGTWFTSGWGVKQEAEPSPSHPTLTSGLQGGPQGWGYLHGWESPRLGRPWSRGWRLPGGGLQREGAFKSIVLEVGSAWPHKPGHYDCRRQASGQGPRGSCGVHPSAGLLQRVPPPGSRGVALCLHPEGKEKLRRLQDYRAPWKAAFLPLCPFAMGWEAHPLSLHP